MAVTRRRIAYAVLLPLLIAGLWFHWYQGAPRNSSGPIHLERPAGEHLHFFLLGDTGTGNAAQMQVAAALEQRCRSVGGDGIFLLGDNFYQHGVQSVDDPQWQEKIRAPYGSPCLAKLPIYAVLGNHDYYGNPSVQIAYGAKDPRWILPHRFYDVTFGHLLEAVVFDSNFPDVCFMPAVCAVDFMEHALATTHAKWRLVLAHHPILTSSLKYHGAAPMYRWSMSHLVCDRADAYVSGHAHMLEARDLPGCHTQLFIAGGGGGDLNPVPSQTPADSHFVAGRHGFLELEVTPERLSWQFFDDKGQPLYSTQTTKS